MAESLDRVCVGCGGSEQSVVLESCRICSRSFCADCAQRGGYGHRFCSVECTRAYYFAGDPDDHEDADAEE